MKNSDISLINVYNTKGLLVKTFNGIQFLDLSGLTKGFYLIEFLQKNSTIKRQLLTI